MIDDTVKMVEDHFKRAQENQSSAFDRFDRLYKIYRAVDDQSQFAIVTRSRYVVPVAWKTVETIVPRIISVLFSATPPIQSRYRLKAPDMGIRFLDATFGSYFDQNRSYWTTQAWLREGCILGQSYLKIGWRQSKRTYIDKKFENGTWNENEKTDIVEDGLDEQWVSPYDLFFDPEAYFPDVFGTAGWVIHHMRKPKSYLLKQRDAGIYLPFDDNDLKASDQIGSHLDTVLNYSSSSQKDHDDPLIDIYEHWEDEHLVATAGHRVKLRDEGNPFGLPGKARKKPFVAFVDNLIPGTLWQVGEVEPIEHNQIETSTLRRQRTDNNSLIINRMWIYNKQADVDLEALELSRPGGAVGCNPVDGSITNAVQPLSQTDINGASFREFADLSKDAQETSGLLDYAVGASPERRETATTVQLLQTAANSRFDIKIRNANAAMLERGRMMHDRWKQLQTKPLPVRVMLPGQLQPIYHNVTRDDLPSPDDVELIAPGNPNLLLKDARQQKLLQFYQSMVQNPAVNPQAGVEMLKIALREAEIDGVEVVLAMLDQGPPPVGPDGMPLGVPGNGGPPQPNAGGPPNLQAAQPIKPPMPSRPPGANENPIMVPHPSPRS